MKAFTKGKTRLHSAYDFTFLYADALTAEHARKALSSWGGDVDEGWPSWAFSNHDAPRAVSRWAPSDAREDAAKLYLMALLSLRGGVFVYQGEELGLPQADVAFEDLQDPEAIANWPLTLGRDGARTPMPWRSGVGNAGFSDGEPWLPVDPRHAQLAVDAQENSPASCLNFARAMLKERRASACLRHGSLTLYDAPDGILAFERRAERQSAVCAFNFSSALVDWSPPKDLAKARLVASVGFDGARRADANRRPPTSFPGLSGYVMMVEDGAGETGG